MLIMRDLIHPFGAILLTPSDGVFAHLHCFLPLIRYIHSKFFIFMVLMPYFACSQSIVSDAIGWECPGHSPGHILPMTTPTDSLAHCPIRAKVMPGPALVVLVGWPDTPQQQPSGNFEKTGFIVHKSWRMIEHTQSHTAWLREEREILLSSLLHISNKIMHNWPWSLKK